MASSWAALQAMRAPRRRGAKLQETGGTASHHGGEVHLKLRGPSWKARLSWPESPTHQEKASGKPGGWWQGWASGGTWTYFLGQEAKPPLAFSRALTGFPRSRGAWGTALAPGCPCTGPERVSKGLTGSGWGAARATAGAENNSEWPSQSEDVTEDDGVRTRLQGGGGI